MTECRKSPNLQTIKLARFPSGLFYPSQAAWLLLCNPSNKVLTSRLLKLIPDGSVIQDSSSSLKIVPVPQRGAVAAFNKLIHQDSVPVILGPVTSSATRVAFPLAQDSQVVAISPTSGARGLSAIGNFVFRIPLTTDVVVPKGIEATQAKLGYQRVATLYDETDLFSTDRDETLQETFAANSIEVLTTETFQSGDTDFTAQLTRIKALEPDAIFVSALPPEKPGILVQAHELGISVPFIVSSLTSVEVQAAGCRR